MNKILIQFAHPALHKSRVNQELIKNLDTIEGITFRNLYECYPDFYIDVKKEQELLLAHDILVWHHPFYWYSSPSLLKEWIDLVLQHNFAYGKKGNALKGKKVLTVITTGGSKEAYSKEGYNHCQIHDLLLPFRKTAELCKMEYLPPFVIHGTHLLNTSQMGELSKMYESLLVSLRDDYFLPNQLGMVTYLNDLLSTNKS